MNFASVLVVTYGRSGSTLLQGVLNAIPGCVVRGENENFCHGLFLSWRALQTARRTHGGDAARSPTDPWYGMPDTNPERFLKDAGLLIRNQLLGGLDPASVQCLGFKEIRYIDNPNLPAYLDFLEQVFPSLGVVFLTREHDSVSRSAWWREKNPEVVKAKLALFEKTVAGWAKDRSNVFHIDYADLVANGARLASMFTFLGAAYDRETVRQVLDTPHSYVPKTSPGKGQESRAPARLRVLKFAVDTVKAWPAAGGEKRFAGGVLLLDKAQPNVTLRARAGDSTLACEWGIASPKVGAEFAEYPDAPRSRFRIDVTGCPARTVVRLEVTDTDGLTEVVGEIPL